MLTLAKTHENELTRAFKTVNDSYIEPISFIVPRRAEVFQEDIYPPTVGSKASMSSADYFNGKEGMPSKISLESVYDGSAPKEVPSDYKPSAPIRSTETVAPTPTKTKETEPSPVQALIAREPPPSLKDNKASIASMASKFADKDEESSDNETSSFEEVPRPSERSSKIADFMPPKAAQLSSKSVSASSTPTAETEPAQAALPRASEQSSLGHRSTPSGADGLRAHLQDIKAMLAMQTKTIETQNEKLDALTREVEKLKSGGGSMEKDERIRMLEMELEDSR